MVSRTGSSAHPADEEAHWAALRKLACPTLVLDAGESPYTRSNVTERMVERMRRARMVTVSGAGHDIHIDRREALLAELRAFLTAG